MGVGAQQVGLGLDEHGWIEQQQSREPYEAVREAVQNSMDAAADSSWWGETVDINVRIGYGDNYVVVEDSYSEGVNDLSLFYNVFAGSKRDSAEKRGRFGRGTKELIAAADRTVIHTTGGTAIFTIDKDRGGQYAVKGDIYEDIRAEEGTYIFARNREWDDNMLREIQDYVEKILTPDGTTFSVEYVNRLGDRPERVQWVKPERDPDAVMEDVQLNTITFDETGQNTFYRNTDVEIYRTAPGDGGIYEMEIPVTTGEEFPFIFNVQQRTPVAEQRNMLSDTYRRSLVQLAVNHNLDLFEDEDLAEDYVTQSIKTVQTPNDVQHEYIRRRWGQPEHLLLETRNTTDYTRDRAEQLKDDLDTIIDITNTNHGRTIRQLLQNHVETVEGWVQQRNEAEQITPVEPSPEQEAFMDFVDTELIFRSRARPVDQEMAEIAGGEGRGSRALHKGRSVRYNVLADDWEGVTPERVGTAIHELAHDNATVDTHGEDWYKAMERIAGDVIVDQHEEIQWLRDATDDELVQELDDLRQENLELQHHLDQQYAGPGDYLRSKLAGIRNRVTR